MVQEPIRGYWTMPFSSKAVTMGVVIEEVVMFEAWCPDCRSQVLLSARRVLDLSPVPGGHRVVLRCWCGAVVDASVSRAGEEHRECTGGGPTAESVDQAGATVDRFETRESSGACNSDPAASSTMVTAPAARTTWMTTSPS